MILVTPHVYSSFLLLCSIAVWKVTVRIPLWFCLLFFFFLLHGDDVDNDDDSDGDDGDDGDDVNVGSLVTF